MERLIQSFISGLLMGGVYSAIAVNFSLAFSVMKLLTGHGEPSSMYCLL